jgi:hypothetical protein
MSKSKKEILELYATRSRVSAHKRFDARAINDDTLNNCSSNKIYPDSIEKSFLVALSHFPELRTVSITVRYAPCFTIMAAWPRLSSLWKTRSYVLFINSAKQPFRTPLFDELSFNAQVGCMAHELSHIVDYHKRTKKSLLGFLFRYLYGPTRKRIEWETDLQAINRGFAWQVYDFVHEMTQVLPASKLFRAMRKKNYLTANELHEYIKKKV